MNTVNFFQFCTIFEVKLLIKLNFRHFDRLDSDSKSCFFSVVVCLTSVSGVEIKIVPSCRNNKRNEDQLVAPRGGSVEKLVCSRVLTTLMMDQSSRQDDNEINLNLCSNNSKYSHSLQVKGMK